MADGLLRWALVVAYEGTGYCGFQIQANAPTIQGELESALTRLSGDRLRISAASRTDSGAHARGQVVSFTTRARLPATAYVHGLNSQLPPAIAVQAAYRVPLSFHPRRDASSREYRYTLLNQPSPSPLERRTSLWVRQSVNTEAMARASQALVGLRDFSAFAGPLGHRDPHRTVFQARITKEPPRVYLDMAADGFLPQMVRRCAGALLQVGLGRCTLADFQALVAAGAPHSAGPSLPSHGLCLLKVNYPDFPPQGET